MRKVSTNNAQLQQSPTTRETQDVKSKQQYSSVGSFSKTKLLNGHHSANTVVHPIRSTNKFDFDSLLTNKRTKTNSESSASDLDHLKNLRNRNKRLCSLCGNHSLCYCLMLITILGLLIAVSVVVPTVLLTSRTTTTFRKTQPTTFLHTNASSLSTSNNVTQTIIQTPTTNSISSTVTVSISTNSITTTSSNTNTTISTSTSSTTSSGTSSTTSITTDTTTSSSTSSTTASTSSSSTTSSSTSSTDSTTTMISSTTVSTITVTTTTPVVTVTITSNICTANWTGIQIFGHCINCSTVPFYYGFVANFTAIGTVTRMVLGLRAQNGYFACDDLSVQSVAAPGVELLTNGGFENGSLLGWSYCNQNNASNIGGVKSNSSNFTYLGFTYYARTGSYYYFGGSNISADYLSQTFATTIGQIYTVTTWYLYAGSGPLGSADLFMGL